jgi:2-polyprenyl-3-methyl-5-hydroxy-6-metoxy-1,4-benzoquinol methylase
LSEPASLKKVPCAVCGSDNFAVKYGIKDLQIVQCKTCSFVYVNPRIEDENLYTLYRKNYFSNPEIGYSDYSDHKDALVKTFEKRFTYIKPFLWKHENVLDIGCASGYFLDVLESKGWKGLEGIELDPDLANQLNLKYKVYTQPIEKITPEKKYDLITLFDVIEHIPLLDEALENIKKSLDKNGIFAISTPNYNSWQRKLLSKRWPHFKPLEHIYYFSPETLEKILIRHKFQIIKTIPHGTYYSISYIQKRLKQYGFGGFYRIVKSLSAIFKLDNYFYLNSGSMLLVVKHAEG